MKKGTIALAAMLGLLLVLASNAAAAINCSVVRDNFDRGNSATLGSNWTLQAPSMGIEGQRATNPNATFGLATFNGISGDAACADVSINGAATQYVAIVLDYADVNNNLFIKVQDNLSNGTFNRAFFYHGNSGTPFAPFQDLTPFTSARIAVARNGDNVTLEIDTNFDGVPEQAYTVAGANLPGLGTGLGLGAYGHAFADNFATPKPPVSNAFTVGQTTKNKKKGTATISVNVPGPGTLALSGQGIKSSGATASRAMTAASTVRLNVTAKGKKKKKLNDTGKVAVKPTITYTPTGGTASSQSVSVKLKKNI